MQQICTNVTLKPFCEAFTKLCRFFSMASSQEEPRTSQQFQFQLRVQFLIYIWLQDVSSQVAKLVDTGNRCGKYHKNHSVNSVLSQSIADITARVAHVQALDVVKKFVEWITTSRACKCFNAGRIMMDKDWIWITKTTTSINLSHL